MSAVVLSACARDDVGWLARAAAAEPRLTEAGGRHRPRVRKDARDGQTNAGSAVRHGSGAGVSAPRYVLPRGNCGRRNRTGRWCRTVTRAVAPEYLCGACMSASILRVLAPRHAPRPHSSKTIVTIWYDAASEYCTAVTMSRDYETDRHASHRDLECAKPRVGVGSDASQVASCGWRSPATGIARPFMPFS